MGSTPSAAPASLPRSIEEAPRAMNALPARKRRRSITGGNAADSLSLLAESSGRSASTRAPLVVSGVLLEADDHPVRSRQRLHEGPAIPCFLHPFAAIRAGEIEASVRFDEHVQTHEQAERILFPGVVDERFMHDQSAFRRERLVRLAQEHH